MADKAPRQGSNRRPPQVQRSTKEGVYRPSEQLEEGSKARGGGTEARLGNTGASTSTDMPTKMTNIEAEDSRSSNRRPSQVKVRSAKESNRHTEAPGDGPEAVASVEAKISSTEPELSWTKFK
jgi:hypothetical protein